MSPCVEIAVSKGGLELILNHEFIKNAPTDLKELVDDAYISSATAISILNDLLLYESVDAGSFKLEKSRVPFPQWSLNDISRNLNQFARSHGVDFDVIYEPCDGPQELSSLILDIDPRQVEQVIRNLVSNAIKFTKEGGKVQVRLCPASLDQFVHASERTPELQTKPFAAGAVAKLHVAVVDSGAGISPENQTKLFSQFMQVKRNELQGGGGSGLGLWISRQIIELHGGNIGFFSDGAGTGSTFYFELPLFQVRTGDIHEQCGDFSQKSAAIPRNISKGDLSERLKPALDPIKAMSILLVDDSPLNRKILKRMLIAIFSETKNREFSFTEVSDGEDAVAAVKATIDQPFTCIFMDSSLIKVNGPEATIIIRKDLKFNNPIIGLTGQGLPEQCSNFLVSGVDCVLTKPISGAQLKMVLREVWVIY